jgi:hypothetical protein
MQVAGLTFWNFLVHDIAIKLIWKSQVESTTDSQWDRIAEMGRQEIAAGDITPLAEVFPPLVMFWITPRMMSVPPSAYNLPDRYLHTFDYM